MQKIEVLLADDNREFTNLLAEYISEQDDMVVSGIAYNGEEVLEMIDQAARVPDVLILDIIMPHLDGLGVLERIRDLNLTPQPKIIMLTAFELFREAGIRLPTAIGMTLTVVGGLVIGDASIRAGLTSPSLLVVIAITAVSSFTLVNQSLVGAVSIVRLVTILAASVLGIFGFLLSVFVILVYLAKIRSFGLPYLAPVSPFNFGDFVHALFRLPRTKITRRPNILGTTDSKRRKGAKHS